MVNFDVQVAPEPSSLLLLASAWPGLRRNDPSPDDSITRERNGESILTQQRAMAAGAIAFVSVAHHPAWQRLMS